MTKCEECGGDLINNGDETYCSECGLVNKENLVENSVREQSDEYLKSDHHHPPVREKEMRLLPSDTKNRIGSRNPFNGKTKNKWTDRESKKQDMYRKIRIGIREMGLPDIVNFSVVDKLDELLEDGEGSILKNRAITIEDVISALIYHYSTVHGCPRPKSRIIEVCDGDNMLNCYRLLQRHNFIKYKPIKMMDTVEWLCKNLDLEPKEIVSIKQNIVDLNLEDRYPNTSKWTVVAGLVWKKTSYSAKKIVEGLDMHHTTVRKYGNEIMEEIK